MKKKILLKIEAEFGSDFQKQSALDYLALVLKAWDEFYKGNHKKNKIKWELVEED